VKKESMLVVKENKSLIEQSETDSKKLKKLTEENNTYQTENSNLKKNEHLLRSGSAERIEEVKNIRSSNSLLKYNIQRLEENEKILKKKLEEAEMLIKQTESNLEKTLRDFEDHDNTVFNEIQTKYEYLIKALQANIRTSTPIRNESHGQVHLVEIRRLETVFFYLRFYLFKNLFCGCIILNFSRKQTIVVENRCSRDKHL